MNTQCSAKIGGLQAQRHSGLCSGGLAKSAKRMQLPKQIPKQKVGQYFGKTGIKQYTTRIVCHLMQLSMALFTPKQLQVASLCSVLKRNRNEP